MTSFIHRFSQSKRQLLKLPFSTFFLGSSCLLSSSFVTAQVIQTRNGSPFSLFASRDLSAWTQQGNANWTFDAVNNEVFANQGTGYILSRLALADSEVTMEYWMDHNTIASLGIRCANPYLINGDNAYLIGLSNLSDPIYPAGSIIGFSKAAPGGSKFGWNTLLVKASGNQLSVVLNNNNLISNFIDNRFKSGQLAVILSRGIVKIRTLNIIIPGRW